MYKNIIIVELKLLILDVAEQLKLDQDFAVNGERLTSLHAKLHQEADKIRKWKNQTEIDIRQKVFLKLHVPRYIFFLSAIVHVNLK